MREVLAAIVLLSVTVVFTLNPTLALILFFSSAVALKVASEMNGSTRATPRRDYPEKSESEKLREDMIL